LDPVVQAGGPVGPAQLSFSRQEGADSIRTLNKTAALRLRIEPETVIDLRARRLISYVVESDAQGGENALGFSIRFDPARMRFMRAVPANDLVSALLNINAVQVSNGHLGFALALPAGEEFTYGSRQVLIMTFAITVSGGESPAPVELGDTPIPLEIVDA